MKIAITLVTIGLLIMFGLLLVPIEETELDKARDEVVESLETVAEAEEKFNDAIAEEEFFINEAKLEYVDRLNRSLQGKEDYMLGIASYYDYVLDSGWSSVGHYVCATRDFKRYSMVRATNVANGKSVDCKVTDYGPDASIFPERIIDLSSTAFSAISDTKLGVINVIVEQL